MVIYCMSDIHGELDKFERMLDLIHFSDEDHLYILGDVIDRGALGVDILRRIMAARPPTGNCATTGRIKSATRSCTSSPTCRTIWS